MLKSQNVHHLIACVSKSCKLA